MEDKLTGMAILLIWIVLMAIIGWATRVQKWSKNIEKQIAAQQSVQRTCAKCGVKNATRYNADDDEFLCGGCGASR